MTPTYLKVSGCCPCGCGETLFLGDGGYVTCSWHECPAPDAATDLLRRVEKRAADDRMIGDDRTDIVVYTQGWDKVSAPEDEPPKTQIQGRLFINGVEINGFANARLLIGLDFMQVAVRLYPSTFQIVPLGDIRNLHTVLPEVEAVSDE